nr:MAG TPA: hypothetical protein [Caudoviricetes sp.]
MNTNTLLDSILDTPMLYLSKSSVDCISGLYTVAAT